MSVIGATVHKDVSQNADSAIDRFDLTVLAGFAGVSMWVLVLAIAQAIGHGRSWTGTDGIGLQDQMQYVAWIRDASRHVLASNLFVLTPTPHDYLQPLVAISGGLAALSVAPWLALLLWKPVAVGGVFFAIRAYVRGALVGVRARRAALVLALFFVGPGQLIAQAIRHFGHLTFPWLDVTLDPWIGWWSWGYPFGLIALAAMVTAVLAYSREREGNRVFGVSALLGALASWLHPWQGATLITILVASELGERARTRARVSICHLLLTTGATALPIAYYGALARLDVSWKLGEAASRQSWPLWALAVCELPLALPAVFAYMPRPLTFLGRATRAWPIAALVVFLLSETSGGFALHAFLGVNVPLALLAVQGWALFTARLTWLRRPAVAWLAIAALSLPSLVEQLRWASQRVSVSAQAPRPQGHGSAQFIDRGEALALKYLASVPQPGGVLTRSYLGTIVPGTSGRPTYVGDSFWSDDFSSRQVTADNLFLGRMPADVARVFVRDTGAKFVLVDCNSRADLGPVLAALIVAAHRFGCASVYTLR
jgi:hypothetical protein